MASLRAPLMVLALPVYLGLAGLAALPGIAVAQMHGCSSHRPMVDAVHFRGNRALSSVELAPIIATEHSGIWRRWFGWNVGPLSCLDSTELRRDALRIHDQYAQRGYRNAVVTSAVTRRGTQRAQVQFTIVEGPPIIIDAVTITGVPTGAADTALIAKQLMGVPYDDSVRLYIRDSVLKRIRSIGYARAKEPKEESTYDSVALRGQIHWTYEPGRVNYIGAVSVEIAADGKTPALSEHDILEQLRFKPGYRFSGWRVGRSQRDLYDLALYRTVRIDTLPSPDSLASDTIPLVVRLAEIDRRHVRTGAGWGTLDCFRTQARFVEQNFLNHGHKFELDGKMSKIGLAHPFSGLQGFCAPSVRDDPFSQRLNYYIGTTISLRGIPALHLKPTFTVFAERRSEFLAYEQSTDLGVVASLSRELGLRLTGALQYQYVDGRTLADRAVSCERFGFCRLEDLTSFLLPSPIHRVGITIVKNPLSAASDPVSGERWQLETKYGHTDISRRVPLDFGRLFAEGALYRPFTDHFVLAMRAQFGFIFAPKDHLSLLPPTERFYSGGQNTVRGYDQNLLGPGSYIVSTYQETTLSDGTVVGVAQAADGYRRIAPSGGNAMWVANLELRTRNGWPGGLLRWVAFVDAGRVWNSNDVFSVTNANPRVTPGIGARLLTPLGPFRVDIGYNPYAPDAGPAFFILNGDLSKGQLGRAICVSPGTTEPLTTDTQQTNFCPATFKPNMTGGLLRRLTFNFSIGSAF